MKIFISGATGYIGYRLAKTAAEKGWTVHALVRDPSSKYRPIHENIILFKGDITRKGSIEKAMEGCSSVFHTAAFTHETIKSSPEFFNTNVQGTRNVLEVALANKVSRFVFTGSCSIYGSSGDREVNEETGSVIDPTTPYSISKYEAEKIVSDYNTKGISTVILRPSRIYGPGHLTTGNPITKLIVNILKNRIAFMPADSSMIGNYVFVDDVVKAHFLALEKSPAGEKYIIGGENISYIKFFQTLRTLSKKNFLIVPVSKTVFKFGAKTFNGFNNLFGRKYISSQLIDRIWQNRALSSEKATRQLGYTITPLEEGLIKTLTFLKNIDHH
jgi:nucleoside-diphosphate-sugar epimerase